LRVSATPNPGFTGFSGGLTGTTTPQSLTMTAPATVTATYQPVPTTTIQSVPPGLIFTVDNTPCPSPCLMQWTPDTTHTIAAGTQTVGGNTQYVFASWNQGTAATQTITAPAASFTYIATFTPQYAVSTYVAPSSAGTVTLTPPGGWYPAGTQVAVGAAVNSGWAFTGFTGALSSAIAPQSLTVTAPVTLTANFTPDFALSIPTPVTTTINGTQMFTVTVTGQNGFNDDITFDAPLLPTGATFTPLTVHGPGSYNVTIHAPLTGGTFAFTLRGTAGPASAGLTHGVAGTLAVQDFTITPLTQTLSGGHGDTVKYVFAVAPLGGFNGTLSVPTYPTFTAVNPPYGGNPSCGSSNAYVDSGPGVGTVTVSITLNSCSSWTFDVRIPLASGGITHFATVQLQGVTTGIFSLSTPLPPPSAANNQVNLPVHVTSNFSGQTVLFSPYWMTAGCGTVSGLPDHVTVSAAAPADFSLNVDTTTCPLGTWNVIVMGQDGTVTQSLALPFVVGPTATPPDFGLQPTPSTLTIAPGASGVYTLNVAPLNGFNQTVTLAATGLPAGVTATFPAGSTVNGAGTASLRVAAATTATPGTYTFTITGTAAQLAPRTAALTLNIVAPPAGTGFTFADLPTVTIPADGTVVPASIAVTPLSGSTATIALQSNSTLPLGINATISGHTLILSAAAGVPAGDYYLDLIGNDGSGGEGSGNTSHGRCPVHVGQGGSGDGEIVLLSSGQIGVPNNGQATRLGPYWIMGIGGLDPYHVFPAATVTGCSSASAGLTAAFAWPSQSNPSSMQLFDITYTATATGDGTVTCTVDDGQRPGTRVSVYDATVYDPTPQIDTVTLTDPSTGTYTITGNSFGAPGPGGAPGSADSVIVCALESSTGPCNQTGDVSVGTVIWAGTMISVVLTSTGTASGPYCVQVQSGGVSGSHFNPAPNGGSGATSTCAPLPITYYTISGTVLKPDGRPMPGPTLTMHNPYVVAGTRDTNGAYSFTVMAGSSPSIAISNSPYTFQFDPQIPHGQGNPTGCTGNPVDCSFYNVRSNLTLDFKARPYTTVFLLHGINQTSSDMTSLAQHLANVQPGLDLARFVIDSGFDFSECNSPFCTLSQYGDTCGISAGGKSLAKYVSQHSPGDFVLVGYSMGGVIARDMLVNTATNPAYVNVLDSTHHIAGLITAGSPLLGYPYVPIDNLKSCANIELDLTGYWNPSDSTAPTAPAQLSSYLLRIQSAWSSSLYGHTWVAAAGSFCSNPYRNIGGGVLDLLLSEGCRYGPNADGKNDGVVCRDSALYSANSPSPPPGAPFPREYPHYSHTKAVVGLGTFLVMGCVTGTDNPALSDPTPGNVDHLFEDIVYTLNNLPTN
jgi:pimeloyl-ACP methyl ester carboxylesterase